MRLAILFPGQGSQSVGMLSGFAGNDAVARVMARSSEALGEDLEKLISEGPAEKLGLTVNTQPVMLACSVSFANRGGRFQACVRGAARAVPRPGDAGSGAGGSWRHGRDHRSRG